MAQVANLPVGLKSLQFGAPDAVLQGGQAPPSVDLPLPLPYSCQMPWAHAVQKLLAVQAFQHSACKTVNVVMLSASVSG